MYLKPETISTSLTALHERRSRLIQLDIESKVNERSVGTLRARINECTDAINDMKGADHA